MANNPNEKLCMWFAGGLFVLFIVYNFGVYIVGFLAFCGVCYLAEHFKDKPPDDPRDRWRS